jgi:hypothetical protein
MKNPTDVHRRLLFILHRCLVEVRLLAQAGKQQQVFDLADALEPLPGWIAAWKTEYLDAVRSNLTRYAKNTRTPSITSIFSTSMILPLSDHGSAKRLRCEERY